MNKYITLQWFKQNYLFDAIDNQNRTDQQINYAIQVASSRVDTLASGVIKKGIREGYYKYSDEHGLTLDESKIQDPMQLLEAKDATQCIYEQVAAVAKFAIDTGWDFMSGSFSSSLGSQSDSETIDFEASKDSLEKTVAEALRIYDFTTFMFVESIQIGFDDDDYNYTGGSIWSKDRPLTEKSLVAKLTDPNWLKGINGIEIKENIPGQPSKGIYIKLTATPDNAIPYLTDKYANFAEFANNAKDGELVKYDQMPDGTNTKGVIYLKTPNGTIQFQSKDDNDKIYQPKGEYQPKGNYALATDLSMDDADINDMPARPVLTADAKQDHNAGHPRK